MGHMENQLATRWGRFKTYLDLLFVDHAIFRVSWTNFSRVGGQLYRSNQPMQRHIRSAARMGIKTLVNLRGENPSSWYYLEAEACERYGIDLVNFPVKSRDAPSKELIRGAADLFETITYPALMHCKSGADRAGLMGVLYLLLHEKRPLDEAIAQLAWSHGHVKSSKTGVLDHFFDIFTAETREAGTDLLTWIDQSYDPAAVKASFRPGLFGQTLGDWVLRRE
jgi:protein tyrosine/serine phosphatase